MLANSQAVFVNNKQNTEKYSFNIGNDTTIPPKLPRYALLFYARNIGTTTTRNIDTKKNNQNNIAQIIIEEQNVNRYVGIETVTEEKMSDLNSQRNVSVDAQTQILNDLTHDSINS